MLCCGDHLHRSFDVSHSSDTTAGVGVEVPIYTRRSATLLGRPVCAGCIYGRPSPVSLSSFRDSPGAGRLLASADLEPTTHGPPIARTHAVCIQAPAQDPPVPALDSAGCSCVCRVPSSSGAVVTVQRVRRRLRMSRLDSTRVISHILPV